MQFLMAIVFWLVDMQVPVLVSRTDSRTSVDQTTSVGEPCRVRGWGPTGPGLNVGTTDIHILHTSFLHTALLMGSDNSYLQQSRGGRVEF